MFSINLDPLTSKIIVIVLLVSALIFGAYKLSDILNKIEVEKIKQELYFKHQKDSLNGVILVQESELKKLYELISNVEEKVEKRNEETFKTIDSLRSVPFDVKYREWAKRYLK